MKMDTLRHVRKCAEQTGGKRGDITIPPQAKILASMKPDL